MLECTRCIHQAKMTTEHDRIIMYTKSKNTYGTVYLSLTHWFLALVSATKSLGSTSSIGVTRSYSLGHFAEDMALAIEGKEVIVGAH